MYFKDKYMWTEEDCYWFYDEWICDTITHTEYWIKRSVSTDQHHWSAPENVVQVKSTTGNPVVIEEQDGSYIMYYKDKYVWTEQNCYWEGCPWDCQYVCDTITHTEYWIYRRTSTDGLIWGSPVKVQQTTFSVRNIAAIQKQDSTYLMCYTDKVGTKYYIRQKTSSNGITWSSPSNIIQVNSGTGNPSLLQRDNGTVYLAYRKGDNYVYVLANSGGGWSSPVQTTAAAQGDPALIETDSDIVLIYKGTDGHCYRISSTDGATWSSPSQIAPNKIISDPATVARKDRFYRVTTQYVSASATDLVKVLEFSYEGEYYLPNSCDVLIRDDQTLQSSMHFEYDSKGRIVERISKDEQGVQTEKIVYTYNNKNKVIRQDVYAGISAEISYSTITGYDNKGNVVYTKGPEGAEHFYSYANTDCANQFVDSKGEPVDLFSNTFYTNSVPTDCHTLVVGEAFISRGKVTEIYYKYDTGGNLTETKTLFPTRDYAVFSGTFDENTQTTFEFDLAGLTITDSILVISSIAVPTQETLHETHSEVGNGWLNSGSWSGKYFLADYLRCQPGEPPDCFDGETKIGPFEHCRGSPGYTSYTTWVEDNRTQHVETSYSAIVNEYPGQTEYKVNSGSWTTITDNLGSGTTSTVIPASSFVQGLNTLQFQESNTYSTKFEWVLYIDQGATPEEYITSYTYDSYGNATSVTDAEGHTKTYFYSNDYQYAYLTAVTNALGNTFYVSYDFETGLVTSITSANGNTTTYHYDLLRRITKKVNPDLSELEVVYDDLNNCVTMYNELDGVIKKYYDGLNRLQAVEWFSDGQVYATETYTYDYLNNLVSRTDSGGHTYSYEYDSRGRTIKTINPCGNYGLIEYDDVNARVKSTDENGHCRELQYDWAQRMIEVREYTDSIDFYLTQYEYDQAGSLTRLVNANGEETILEYDSFFGPTLIIYPDGTARSFSYDGVGNILSETDGSGTTFFTYNVAYQRIQVQYADGSLVQSAYDPNGNCLSISSDHETTTCTYNNRNQLISTTHQIDGVNYTFTYNYDAAGRLLSLTYPNGTVVSRTYDDLNRPTSVGNYAQYEYSLDSLVETMTYGNGVVTDFSYDQCHHPTSIAAERSGEELLHLEYTYDYVGNITQLIRTWVDPISRLQQTDTESYQYDALNRMVSAVNGFNTISFSYDPLGNRTQQILNGNTTTYTYFPHNRLATAGEWTFTYDANGNSLSKTSDTEEWLYEYDVVDRLVEIQHNGQICGTYVYNGNSQRIKKTEWNVDSQQYETTIYLYSWGDVYYEKNETTGLDAFYIYGPKGRVAKQVGEEVMYYHVDHLGSTRLLTDASGEPITAVGYRPFGTTENMVGENEKYLFTGHEKDSTGLYYCKARFFDPEIGRFLTQDSWMGDHKRPQSLNKYTYCMNNPLRYRDPSGNIPRIVEEIGEDIVEDSMMYNLGEQGDPKDESPCTTDAECLGYDIARKLAIYLHEKFYSKSRLVSDAVMREMEKILADENDRNEFEKGWQKGFIAGCYERSSPEYVKKITEDFTTELDDDLQCLVDHLSNEMTVEGLTFFVSGGATAVVGVVKGVLIPTEVFQAAAYIAKEHYKLTVGEEYEENLLANLDEYCCEESRTLCAGTFLIYVFLVLGMIVVSLQHRKRRLP